LGGSSDSPSLLLEDKKIAIEHNVIADGERHEPKGIASAASGQIYMADGASSGVWRSNGFNVHGDLIISSNTTATNTTAATDSTLATDSDYVKITAGWSLAHGEGITLNVDEMVVPEDGDYFITFWADVKTPTTNNFVGVKYSINDTTPYSTRKIIAQSQSANDYLNLSGSGIVVSLSANDTISMYIASTKTDALIVQEAGLVGFLMHPGN